MSSDHKPSAEHFSHTEDTEVTIKFVSKEETTQVKASKEKLIAGSGYFATHWLKHPRSSGVKAPKFIVPGVTIKQQSIDTAIGYLHDKETPSDDVGDAVELILLARAFGIPTLEIIGCGRIDEQLERSFQIDGLAAAVRELYDGFSENTYCDVGNDVLAIVISVIARVCRRRWVLLRSDPAFKLLCKDFPQLMEDILDAVADEDERYVKEVKTEEQRSVPPQDSPRELLE